MYRSPILSDKIHLLPHVHIIKNPNVQSPPPPPLHLKLGRILRKK
jgi:hypothetical protein